MGQLLTIFLTLILIAGIYFGQFANKNNISKNDQKNDFQPNAVSSGSKEESGNSKASDSASQSQPSISESEDLKLNKDQLSVLIETFIYPGSSIINKDSNKLELSSNHEPDKITDWYEVKIRNLGYTTKTFVKTKTNGDVNNRLIGEKTEHQIEIKITKQQTDNQTKIHLELSNTNNI